MPMEMNERAGHRLSRGHARAVGICLFIAACGGTVGKVPMIGSESHFLAYCETACDAGLECIGGICTRSCLTDSPSCADLGSGAQCTNQSVEPGQVAVCDVSCTLNVDCAPLGTSHTCDAGYCRSRALLDRPVSTGSGGTGGSGGNGGTVGSGGAEAGSEADSALCEAFRDQSPPPDMRVISIVNTGSVPLYVVPVKIAGDCASPTSLVNVRRDGQSVNVLGIPDCGVSCEEAIDGGWRFDEYVPRCMGECIANPPFVVIEPGQTRSQPAGREVLQQALPRACATGIQTDAVTCFARVIPQPGNYTLTVRATAAIQCEPGVLDCECSPDASGVCTNRSIEPVQSSDVVLEFSFPSSWYFDNHELSISAPGG
jgi:hypothetical protein